jgi:hypothetical protein
MTAPQDLVAELRGRAAQQLVPYYRLAAEVELHPGRMGQMLRGTLPMPVEVAERIS